MEQPSERHLRRGHATTHSDLFEPAFGEQTALVHGRVRHDGDVALAAPGQELPFDAAPGEIVHDLVRRDGFAAWKLRPGDHVFGIEIADAMLADLAGALEILETRDRLFERDLADPMKEIEIEERNPFDELLLSLAGDRESRRMFLNLTTS